LQAYACFDLFAAAVFRPTKANETLRLWEGRDMSAGPSCKIITGSDNDEQIAAKRGKFT